MNNLPEVDGFVEKVLENGYCQWSVGKECAKNWFCKM
jgi:hypothetical protein